VLVGLPRDGAPPPVLSVVAGLAAAVSYVFAANFAKHRLSQIPTIVFVTGSQLGAAVFLLPLLPLFPPPQSPGALVIAAVLALAVLSTALAFVIYFQLIRDVGPTRTLTVTYLIPVFAYAWGALLLDEQITLMMLFGGALVLSGVALANSRPTGRLAAVPDKAVDPIVAVSDGEVPATVQARSADGQKHPD
jgi:drug/metabolite transporter (DMT)-like permease